MSRNLIHPSTSNHMFEITNSETKIFFVAIIRNDEILVKYSQLNGNYDEILEQVKSKFVKTNGVKMTFNYENFCFHYIFNNTITYFCITKDVFDKLKAFQFLERIKLKFESQYQKRMHTALPFAFQAEFLPTLAIETKRYSENLSFDKINEVERARKFFLKKIKFIIVFTILALIVVYFIVSMSCGGFNLPKCIK
ncbi:unnamed protein product [Brachionus calyciflorus]|uniref:Longin domain-containing protein n=1 Tax=Brachionus calyciflorus TaxID=104777 RepID=A0A814MLH6_9BILA|nr:unnamed protein product [Brachionus calyciflorus]